MLVITAGIIIGTNFSQSSRSINTAPLAAGGPTPIDLGYTGGRWFDGSQGLICAAEFTCNADPIIQVLEIRSLDGTQKFSLATDATGRGIPDGSPIGKSITGSCSNRSYGISVNWDPRIEYTDAQKRNIKRSTGYDIKKGQILLSVRQSATEQRYFVYDRPTWLTGGEDAIFYFEFDAKTAGITRRYSQIAKGKKGCAPEITATVTPTTPLSGTPSPTPTSITSPTPSPTGTLTSTPIPSATPTGTATSTPTSTLTPTPSCGGPTCPPPTNTPTPTPSCGGPTCPPPTNTPTPIVGNACNYNALVYIQECTPNAKGECERDTKGNFIARALPASELAKFGTINNRQLAGGRYGSEPASRFSLFTGNPTEATSIISTFPYFSGILGSQLAYFRYDVSQPVPAGVDPLKRTTGTTGIFIPPTFTHPNERYPNMETASVRLTLKRPDYRIVPRGNETKYCRNNISGGFIGACDPSAYSYPVDNSVDLSKRDPRDTINGLIVGCGQNIVYGWTVQKCVSNFDYVFVMDTSTSMITTRDITTGKLKKDAASDALQNFLTNIKNSGGDHRASLLQFSSRRNTRTVVPFTNNIDTVKAAALNDLKYEEGTCIECGIRETINLLTNFRADKSRNVVVVFLTDGLPNSDPGNPRAGGYEGEITTEANRLKAMNIAATGSTPPTVIAIGYGNPVAASNPDPRELGTAELTRVIKLISTDDTWAFSTAANISISEVFRRVESSLNSCSKSEALHAAFMKAKDINGDGIINTVDLFALYDTYFQQGQGLSGDLNDDGVINSLDVSLMIGDLGTVVSPELESQ